MQSSSHRIGSIRLQVRGAGPQQAWPLRQELDVLLRAFCDEALDGLLDELDVEGQHVLIPSLELNLGRVNMANMRDKLEQQLREILRAYRPDMEDHSAVFHMAERADVPEARILSATQRRQDQLWHYLRQGYFSWGITNEEITELLAAFKEDPGPFLDDRPSAELLLPQVIRRIIYIVPEAGFAYLLQRLHALWQQMSVSTVLLQLVTPEALQAVFPGNTIPEAHYALILQYLAAVFMMPSSATAALVPVAAARALSRVYTLADKAQDDMPAPIQYYLQDMPEEAVMEEAVATTEEVAEPVIVPFLGLVLLHPFLPAFLRSLGLLNERQQFTSEDNRMKALGALLQLCLGNNDVPEYHMLFPKMLLGMPVDTVPERQLWEPERVIVEEEATGLLQSVIGHWTALRSTSVSGLRESFLQRRGRLHTEDNKILIKIERSGFDMLLDRLPWSYSEIHFPWLQQSILTEW